VALPSIAYRMARVACGDGVAALSFSGPCALDYAAGHALLRGAQGVFLDQSGRDVAYARDGSSQVSSCFGGSEQAVQELLARERAGRFAGGSEKRRPRFALGRPRAAAASALDRAAGCLLGQLIGDSLGAPVAAAEIARAYPDGVRDLADGGYWNTLAGQATDDSELALALARSLVERRGFSPDSVAAAYGRWYASRPFDIGTTTRQALSAAAKSGAAPAEAAMAAASQGSASNGSLMRVSPIGIAARDAREAAEWAAADSRLSHPHPNCVAACAGFAAAIGVGIGDGSPREMYDVALDTAGGIEAADVVGALESARAGKGPADFQHPRGWVMTALQNAFRHLLHSPSPENALIETVGEGGDTDTNGAIAGALLGAAHGRAAWPARWTTPVLACRPMPGLEGGQPRPETYWPDDVPDLAEALLYVSRL
jgi:ADP-ribosylglycohydrolase